MTETGHLAAFLAMGITIMAAVAGLKGNDKLAGRAFLAALAGLSLAFLALVSAFVRSDFSVALTAAHSNSLKPLFYKIAASWGNHEGSMLLWCLVMSLYGSAAALFMPPGQLKARALGIQGLLTSLSCCYLLLASNPFSRLNPPPLEGKGLNPLLQDPALAFHPPLLYLGYVGFSFVFSLAAAALIASPNDPPQEQLGPDWAKLARPWALIAFSTLGTGICLGSVWAYYELGWGGWWFWDPVENASLMPWLAGAALVHSIMLTERNGTLPGWTAFLSVLAFSLSLLGAFLVRSGILTSVHSFALDPERGLFLLAGFLLVGGSAFTILALRVPRLAPAPVPAPLSRGGILVLNNLFLSVAAGTVLIGTLYPLLAEALTGEKISVGPPYYSLTMIPLTALMLLLLPIGPLLRWDRNELTEKKTLLAIAILAAVVLLTGLFISGQIWASLGAGLGVWLIGGSMADLLKHARQTRLLKAIHPLHGRLGVFLAHAGMGLLVLGAVIETQGRIERSFTPAPGETMHLGTWALTFEGMQLTRGPNYEAQQATIQVQRNGRLFTLNPEKRFYSGSETAPTTEIAVHRHIGGHLYVALGDPVRDRPGIWSIRVSLNPLMDIVFAGMALMGLGALAAFAQRAMLLKAEAARTTPPECRKSTQSC